MNDNVVSRAIFALLLVLASTRGASIPAAVDDETCAELCSSCDGVADYEDGHCECSIPVDSAGTECLSRMKRQAQEHGLDLVSCEASAEPRATRCALGTRHKYGKSDIERVASYFMQDGPMTGSIFIAPPYTNLPAPPAAEAVSFVGSSNCESPNVGAPLITQPKEFMPEAESAKVGAPKLKLPGSPLKNIAPRFLSMLGELLTRPILGLPQTIQSVSQMPGVSELVGAPASLLNSVADEMAQDSEVAKANLDEYREVVGKAHEDAMVGAKPACPDVAAAPTEKPPPYSLTNPHPMISWLNPTVGAPAPTQLVGSPMQFATMQLVGLVQNSGQQAATPDQVVGSPEPSGDGCEGQMVGAAAPPVPMIQSLGSIPFGSIVGQMTPTFVITSPMQYYTAAQQPAEQVVGNSHEEQPAEQVVGNALEEEEEEPKKICKKANRPARKFTRDVKAGKGQPEVKFEQTTTTTTEVAMIDRTTTRRPRDKVKTKAEKKL